jgi:dienelactone hydrolase
MGGERVDPNMIGAYGPWASSLVGEEPPSFSYRHPDWSSLEDWKPAALDRLMERLAPPKDIGVPEVEVEAQYQFEDLHIEELSWQLPYGPPTKAFFLKPAGSKGPLPGLLALHDHGGNKYFGRRKICKTLSDPHPMMAEHQQNYYGGRAWACEAARLGYGVLVNDAFPFASRRVLPSDVPERNRPGFHNGNPEDPAQIEQYNRWASSHEDLMAKSLFCGGTTWPGVFLSEDRVALDVLCEREDIDAERVGCGGLSGGGMRTVFLGGSDARIKCAVCVGMMTTWRDYLLNKCYTHTWMVYVPLLPRELDYPEILGLRVPSPTMVLNDEDDQLFTLSEMKRADEMLSEVFKKAGAEDRYRCSFYPGPHKFDVEMQEEAFGWFDSWLK